MRCLVVVHLDADARIVWQSQFVEPYTADRVLGKRPWEFYEGEHSMAFRAAVAGVVTEHQNQTVHLSVSHIGLWRIDLFPCHLREVRVVCVCRQAPPELNLLTERQRRICRLLGEGLGTKELSHRLELSRGTIDNYKTEISSRLGLPARALPAWCGKNAEWL